MKEEAKTMVGRICPICEKHKNKLSSVLDYFSEWENEKERSVYELYADGKPICKECAEVFIIQRKIKRTGEEKSKFLTLSLISGAIAMFGLMIAVAVNFFIGFFLIFIPAVYLSFKLYQHSE